ncbi:hypothetical protein GYH30_035332 [Glycine max]|uniref:Uncharacterized protein n=1 Tax=Glycine max TaxID=3847 RepID=A0A0R0GJ82_SOYBN|nr:hypothetical protein GYH30_035332 [Glycine max]
MWGPLNHVDPTPFLVRHMKFKNNKECVEKEYVKNNVIGISLSACNKRNLGILPKYNNQVRRYYFTKHLVLGYNKSKQRHDHRLYP